ncbi:M20/M25/M40 family metallo-hydrolase [Clostridioides sp. GD02404]|uniref:M20/M25/M40 family metallo-hydrolase n=1 Tax=Clostridioides sp. GD02404 TaxID=3054354 RepID=UPI0038A03A30
MLDKNRLINNFMDMVKIDSPSNQELEMSKWLVNYLKERNIDAIIDDAGEKYGGNTGNVIAYIKGEEGSRPLCLCAHMDQVQPCLGVKPVLDGNIVRSDGTTTLGADDKAGIAAILETLEHVITEKIPHRDIYLCFTICEEAGMHGVKNFNPDNLPCKDMVILDSGGAIGSIAYKAPAQQSIKISFYGKKAHAGIEPEKGINAILVASHAISNMHIGRIDSLTTSNIGKIEGGGATNIVTDKVTLTAEIRSHIPETLEYELNHMEKCCKDAASKFNTTYTFEHNMSYPSFELSRDSHIFKLSEEAIRQVGVVPNPMVIGGGSDANILANLGYNCAILSLGMYDVHTVNEYVNIDELYDTAKIVYHMIKL